MFLCCLRQDGATAHITQELSTQVNLAQITLPLFYISTHFKSRI